MNIKSVRCEQFAGMRNIDVEFTEGLNLIIGDNESGKSTIIELMYNLLFRNVKLDGRKDSDFMERYFPNMLDGPRGDVIDGTLIINTDKGEYILKKEWDNEGGSCRLKVQDGTLYRSTDTVNDILGKELVYGAGVYGELIIPSQKRPDYAIQSIMSELKGKKEDMLVSTRNNLTSVLAKAVLETGGVSIDMLQSKLGRQLALLGSHWDAASNMPEGGIRRGINNPWKREVGLILEAYYSMENTKLMQNRALQAEKNIDIYKKNIHSLKEERKKSEEEKVLFHRYIGIIEQISLIRKSIDEQKNKLAECECIIEKWPGIEEKICQAEALKNAREQAELYNRYISAGKVRSRYEELEKTLEEMTPVDEKAIRELEKNNDELSKLNGMLTGMNIAAKIKKTGKKDIEIHSMVSNREINSDDGLIQITEAVVISIPDIMELQLMPQGVDIDEIKNNINSINGDIISVYERYKVNSVKELRECADNYNRIQSEIRILKEEFDRIIGSDSWDRICVACSEPWQLTESVEEIDDKIAELCEGKSIDQYIGRLESVKDTYEEKYSSKNQLAEIIQKIRTEIDENNNKLIALEDIPEKYKNMESPDTYNDILQTKINGIEAKLSEFEELQIAAERELGDRPAEDYEEEYNEKKEIFEARKKEYERWNHINNVFVSLKNSAVSNPTADIEKNFRMYVEKMSESGVTVTSVDDNIGVKLASGNHIVTYDTLSEGTRDTVSLAFRLAMLNHLYPEGGGFAVFDDPFTDMDPGRTKAAFELVMQYAKNNQVIFISCDKKYIELLKENDISANITVMK